MKKIKVVVMFMASNEIEVEVPGHLTGEELCDYVGDLLDEHLPEVHEGSEFEFPCWAQIDGDAEIIDLG